MNSISGLSSYALVVYEYIFGDKYRPTSAPLSGDYIVSIRPK